MGKLRFIVDALTVSYCDNQIAIHVANNHVTHNKMKRVELHVHYLRQFVQDNIVTLTYCKTNDQVIDIFTKPLQKLSLSNFVLCLGFKKMQWGG